MFTRILVPTDFSPPSDAALEYAKAVAKRFGASLHLLYVVDDPYRAALAAEVYVPEVEGLRDELVANALARLEGLTKGSKVGDASVTTSAVIGTPAWSIVEYAGAHDIDLIIMGTHGRGGMSHLLVGSVAERVLRTAPCPVLTVRQSPEEAKARTGEAVAVSATVTRSGASAIDPQC